MSLSRRQLLARVPMLAAAASLPVAAETAVLSRRWEAGGVALPMLGLGTWQSFDVDQEGPPFAEAVHGMAAFLGGGGRVIDTSPMYGRAEATLGHALAAQPAAERAWLASKIWTLGAEAGARQLARTLELLRRPRIALMQIHNLLDAQVHLRTLERARDAGQVGAIGITHYTAGAHAELERWLAHPAVAALQVNYSLAEPEAAARLLPAARAAGKLVLINRPFAEGAMFVRAGGQRLPGVAGELGCDSAAPLFLKWIAADPAVHVVLTGTRKARHLRDNLTGLRGTLPDAAQREAIARWWRSLPG